MNDIPVVIVSRDRLSCLKQLIDSLLERDCGKNIYILDSDSEYIPLLKYYDEIEKKYKINIIKFKENIGPFYFLDNLSLFGHIHKCNNFFYTDCDCVPITETPKSFLDDINEMMMLYNLYNLGMFLKIDDVRPILYKNLKKQKTLQECEQSSCRTDSIIATDLKYNCKIYTAITDTTFKCINYRKCKMFKKGRHYVTFKLANGRVGYPYEVRHLPWYYDLDNLPEDEKFYISRVDRKISSFYGNVL